MLVSSSLFGSYDDKSQVRETKRFEYLLSQFHVSDCVREDSAFYIYSSLRSATVVKYAAISAAYRPSIKYQILHDILWQ